MAKEDEAERSHYARRPIPARPKGAVEIKPNGIRPVGAPEIPRPQDEVGHIRGGADSHEMQARLAGSPTSLILGGPENQPQSAVFERTVREKTAPKFEFRDSGEEPLPVDNIPKTLDEGSAFHIFSLVLRALRKVDKTTRRRIIGLLNELELGDGK